MLIFESFQTLASEIISEEFQVIYYELSSILTYIFLVRKTFDTLLHRTRNGVSWHNALQYKIDPNDTNWCTNSYKRSPSFVCSACWSSIKCNWRKNVMDQYRVHDYWWSQCWCQNFESGVLENIILSYKNSLPSGTFITFFSWLAIDGENINVFLLPSMKMDHSYAPHRNIE